MIEHKTDEWIEILGALPDGSGFTLRLNAEWVRNPLLVQLATRLNQAVEAWEDDWRMRAPTDTGQRR